MDRKTLSIIGSVLLIIGVFLPFIRVPEVMTFAYFAFSQGQSVFVLGILALLFSILRKYKIVLFIGFASLAIMLESVILFAISKHREMMILEALELISKSYLLYVYSNQVKHASLQWGLIVLSVGAFILLMVGFAEGEKVKIEPL